MQHCALLHCQLVLAQYVDPLSFFSVFARTLMACRFRKLCNSFWTLLLIRRFFNVHFWLLQLAILMRRVSTATLNQANRSSKTRKRPKSPKRVDAFLLNHSENFPFFRNHRLVSALSCQVRMSIGRNSVENDIVFSISDVSQRNGSRVPDLFADHQFITPNCSVDPHQADAVNAVPAISFSPIFA